MHCEKLLIKKTSLRTDPSIFFDHIPYTFDHQLLAINTDHTQADKKLIEKREQEITNNEKNCLHWKKLEDDKKILKSYITKAHFDVDNHNTHVLKIYRDIVQESEKQQQLERQINQVKHAIKEYTKIRELLVSKIQQYNKFHEFVQEVVELSPEYHSVGSIVGRFELLEETREQISNAFLEEMEFQKNVQDEMQKMCTEKSAALELLKNNLLNVTDRSEKVQTDLYRYQIVEQMVRKFISNYKSEEVALKQGIYDLYTLCCYSKGYKIDTLPPQKDQITFVTKTIQYYQEVYNIANEMNKEKNDIPKIPRTNKLNKTT
uniref:DUF4200 domain-containing protein n=1 Tax=Clastoptera arizonana TaxID=38151 RepID=A0A1B6C768_9HEMI